MASVLTIARAIIALSNAIPMVRAIVDQISNLYIDQQIDKIEEIKAGKAKKRAVLINAIKRAENDQQRKELSTILADYSRSK